MMSSIPAISIRQPWAELILLGKKTIEVRSWSTDYRGQLWLHTGQKGEPHLEESMGFMNLYKGGYIGTVTVDAVVPMDPDRWEAWRARHMNAGPCPPGVYAWILSSPRRLRKPIPGPGQLGLFSPLPDIEDQLNKAEF
jgi:hypothetical protein